MLDNTISTPISSIMVRFLLVSSVCVKFNFISL